MSSEHDADEREAGFLGRWARRKEAARTASERPPAEADEAPSDGAAESDDAAPAPVSEDSADEVTDATPSLTDADMPDIETLQPDSDVSGFFSPGVSDALRRRALRRLFHTSRFNVKDGLDDYDDDYTLLQPLGDTMTHDLQRQNDRLAERRQAREADHAEGESETRTEFENETDTEAETDAPPAAQTSADAETPADGETANPSTPDHDNGDEETSRA